MISHVSGSIFHVFGKVPLAIYCCTWLGIQFNCVSPAPKRTPQASQARLSLSTRPKRNARSRCTGKRWWPSAQLKTAGGARAASRSKKPPRQEQREISSPCRGRDELWAWLGAHATTSANRQWSRKSAGPAPPAREWSRPPRRSNPPPADEHNAGEGTAESKIGEWPGPGRRRYWGIGKWSCREQ